jgi:hypothetical protein
MTEQIAPLDLQALAATVARMTRLFRFLDGSDHLDGALFGDRHPDHRGAFWWRHELLAVERDLAAPALIAAAKERDALRAEVARLQGENAVLRGMQSLTPWATPNTCAALGGDDERT